MHFCVCVKQFMSGKAENNSLSQLMSCSLHSSNPQIDCAERPSGTSLGYEFMCLGTML